MKNLKSNKAITLIALIITVIVMMILAGVTVYLAFNGGGLIEKVKQTSIVQELKEVEEQVMLRIEEERLNKFSNNEKFNISDYTSLESFSPKIESKYSEYIRIENGKMYIKTNAPEEIKKVAEKIGIQIKDRINNIRIYGNSIQNGIPSPENPVEIQSVGDLVTDKNDSNYGKYKISIKFTDKEEQSTIENIYLDEPLRKVGDDADYIDFSTEKVVRNVNEYMLKNAGYDVKNITLENGYYRNGYFYRFKMMKVGTALDGLSNVLPTDKSGWNDTSMESFRYGQVNSVIYVITKSLFETKEDVLNYLSNNGKNEVKVYYQLETPTEETINLPNISTLSGMKNVSVETQIQPSKIDVVM